MSKQATKKTIQIYDVDDDRTASLKTYLENVSRDSFKFPNQPRVVHRNTITVKHDKCEHFTEKIIVFPLDPDVRSEGGSRKSITWGHGQNAPKQEPKFEKIWAPKKSEEFKNLDSQSQWSVAWNPVPSKIILNTEASSASLAPEDLKLLKSQILALIKQGKDMLLIEDEIKKVTKELKEKSIESPEKPKKNKKRAKEALKPFKQPKKKDTSKLFKRYELFDKSEVQRAKAAEIWALISECEGVRTDLEDKNNERVVKGKRGPPRKNDQPKVVGKDDVQKEYLERKELKAFITERNVRLISFFCIFRYIYPEEEQLVFFRKILPFMDHVWAQKLLAYMYTYQKLEIKKNEQKQKKGFKTILKKIQKEKDKNHLIILAEKLSGHKPRSQRQLAEETPRIKKIKKVQKKIEKPDADSVENFTDDDDNRSDSSGKKEKKLNVHYNNETYQNWSQEPILREAFSTYFYQQKEAHEIIKRITKDVFTEISSVIKYYEDDTGRKVVDDDVKKSEDSHAMAIESAETPEQPTPEELELQNRYAEVVASEFLDARYTSRENLRNGDGTTRKKTRQEATQKDPWTFMAYYKAIQHCEKVLGLQMDQGEEERRNEWYNNLTISEAIELSFQAGLLDNGLSEELRIVFKDAQNFERSATASGNV